MNRDARRLSRLAHHAAVAAGKTLPPALDGDELSLVLAKVCEALYQLHAFGRGEGLRAAAEAIAHLAEDPEVL